MPQVTIIMPVYNGEMYLREAIDSILDQTLADFEFLILNDGSSDHSADIVRSYDDPRIRLLENEANLGVVQTLNRGLDLASGTFIARMDCDDRSLPNRLARQVAFLNDHPEVGICGTWMEGIGTRAGYIWRYPTDPERIRCCLLFESALAHPSVMMRRDLLERFELRYSMAYQHAEDYGLWVQAARHFALANIPEIVVQYRKHAQQTGLKQQKGLLAATTRIRLEQLDRLGVRPRPDEAALHDAISIAQVQPTREFVTRAGTWLEKLKGANDQAGVYDQAAFAAELGWRWFWTCRLSTKLGLWSWRAFRRSRLSRAANIGWQQQLKFGVRCVLP
jgi:glycosyltransferase involved in cell wall biosynthesis